MIGTALNTKQITTHWDEILRLATSIQQGTVTASLMLRKLGAYPRQNGLALALRELGRLERSLFTLQYLKDVELRRRIHVGLNKGEARNALARAVFFNRLGELRDRTYENQRHRASGLNLVVAAIVLWNTVYIERAVKALRERGQAISDDLLAHLSPLGWEHINLTGDYVWKPDSRDEETPPASTSPTHQRTSPTLSVQFCPFRGVTPTTGSPRPSRVPAAWASTPSGPPSRTRGRGGRGRGPRRLHRGRERQAGRPAGAGKSTRTCEAIKGHPDRQAL